MENRSLVKKYFFVLLLLMAIVLLGCESKTDNTEQQKEPMKDVKTEKNIPEKQDMETNSEQTPPVEEKKISIPDIKGTYSGTFDKKSTVLEITAQTDSSFSGKITINYRQVINQEVKGSFSPATLKISMKDQLHSRYQGKYKGKLSKEGKNISGTFTMDADGQQFTFNLNKK